MITTARKKNYHRSQGSRAQLKQTLISNMVTSNETKSTSKPLLILNKIICRCLTEIKSVWLLISGAGDAVCGVVLSDLERFHVFYFS